MKGIKSRYLKLSFLLHIMAMLTFVFSYGAYTLFKYIKFTKMPIKSETRHFIPNTISLHELSKTEQDLLRQKMQNKPKPSPQTPKQNLDTKEKIPELKQEDLKKEEQKKSQSDKPKNEMPKKKINTQIQPSEPVKENTAQEKTGSAYKSEEEFFAKSTPKQHTSSISDTDLIRYQIIKSWSQFDGFDEIASTIIVPVNIKLDISGRLISVIERETEQYNFLSRKQKKAYKEMLSKARIAIQQATPIQGLNKENFQKWKTVDLNFKVETGFY